jgi:hypothetical protein
MTDIKDLVGRVALGLLEMDPKRYKKLNEAWISEILKVEQGSLLVNLDKVRATNYILNGDEFKNVLHDYVAEDYIIKVPPIKISYNTDVDEWVIDEGLERAYASIIMKKPWHPATINKKPQSGSLLDIEEKGIKYVKDIDPMKHLRYKNYRPNESYLIN